MATEPFSAGRAARVIFAGMGTKTMAETERTRRLREAESRLLELGRYL
jgi:hypothetical protein